MNAVHLIGNLASDPILRQTPNGKDYCSFLLAINRPGEDAGADFFWVKTWNGQAQSCSRFLTKGKKVGVEGNLRSYRKAEGEGYDDSVEVVARRVEFLTPANQGADAAVADAPPATDDEAPAEPVAATETTQDDIPF